MDVTFKALTNWTFPCTNNLYSMEALKLFVLKDYGEDIGKKVIEIIEI